MKFNIRKKSTDLTKKAHRDEIVGTAFQFNDDISEFNVTLTPPTYAEKNDDNVNPTSPRLELPKSPNNLSVSDDTTKKDKKQKGLSKSHSYTGLDRPKPRLSHCGLTEQDSGHNTDIMRKPRSKSLLTPKTTSEQLPGRIKVRRVSFVTANGFEFSVHGKK